MIVVAAGLLAAAPAPAASEPQPDRPLSWHDEKCVRYRRNWVEALARLGPAGLSASFLDAHEAFLASGCGRRADVCPRSPEEFRLANIMVVRAMNAGTASTFPPFACPKAP